MPKALGAMAVLRRFPLSPGAADRGMLKVLLTVPNLDATASPFREAMGLARYLPSSGFALTICALRPDGVSEGPPALAAAGVKCFTARFRPRGKNLRAFLASFRDGRR